MTYAFAFDASACSGCKACQVACKDKNQLPVGVLWRRVYEVSGGDWQQNGRAWTSSIFAYHLSMACNHCEHPKCAGVCPTDAFVTRLDGIVYIDTSRCVGCGYCAWACPYSAPQYDPNLGTMTKCNFCYDNLDEGLSPACVAACPMRVLDIIEINSREVAVPRGVELWELPGTQHPFPLPASSRTEPHLVVKPHPAMDTRQEKAVVNREEVRPIKLKSDFSLIAFTLFTQAAVGLGLLLALTPDRPPDIPAQLAMGVLLGLGMLNSLLHLGTPKRAWRTIAHLKKSWLSREILMAGLFGFSWLALITAYWSAIVDTGLLNALHSINALLGLGLVYSMAQVYRLRSVPAWDPLRTTWAFFASTLLLGGMGLLTMETLTGIQIGSGSPFSSLAAGIGLVSALVLSVSDRQKTHIKARRLRIGLAGLGLAGLALLFFLPGTASPWLVLIIALSAVLGEILGRWQFYASRNPVL